jgi:chromosome partitioning protein
MYAIYSPDHNNATMPTYAFVNQKGGTGKTTTTVSLAGALQEQGQEVLLVDLDRQGNATTWLGQSEHESDLKNYLIEMPDDAPFRQTEWEGLDVLAGGPPTAAAYTALRHHALEGGKVVDRLKRLLQRDASEYDFILIDCPPALDFDTNTAFAAADGAILVCSTTGMSVQGLAQTFFHLRDNVHGVDGVNPNLDVIGVLATMYDRRLSVAKDTLEQLQTHQALGDLVFNTIIRQNTDIEKAWEAREPITSFKAHSRGAEDYSSLADELVAAVAEPA